MDDISIFGVAGATLVMAFVAAARVFGLPTKWAGAAAIIAGLAVCGAKEALDAWPWLVPYVRFLFDGVLLGLAAMGVRSQMVYQDEQSKAKQKGVKAARSRAK